MGLFNINPSLPALSKSTSFAGQRILITGANAGIGFACAHQFLLLGVSTLYIAVRSLPKGQAARTVLLSSPAIKAANPAAEIKLYELDQSTFTSVVSFSRKFLSEVNKLDAMVLNAGREFSTSRWHPLRTRSCSK